MGIINQILDAKVAGIPVGAGLLMTAAFGLSDGAAQLIEGLASKVVPAGVPGLPLLVDGAVAWAVTNINAVNRFLTPELAQLISVAAMTAGINQTVNVTGMVRGLVNQVTGLIPGVSAPAAITTSAVAAEAAPMSGYAMGAPGNMGQVSEAQNVDDVDLLLLSARGFQTA